MKKKLVILKEAKMWKLVDVPISINIVSYKWVFKAKKNIAGNVVYYKTCLVVQEFSQVSGIDYFDTYVSIAQLSSIYTILTIVAAQNIEIYQIDIKGAYLNGKLTNDKIIYMKQPPSFADPTFPHQVCYLVKILYGLK